MNKRSILVNLFGGPGVSKSTTAAGIFSLLKIHDIDCEYVPEFAKDLVWEDRHKSLKNQLYIFAKQYHRLWRLNGVVDVIITDSPLLFTLVYANDNEMSNFKPMVVQSYNSFNNLNYLLKRTKKYNPNGRYQDEEGAKKVDKQIIQMLEKYDIPHTELDGDFTAINVIAGYILLMFQKEMKTHLSDIIYL
jgi:hypothetical protein